MRSPLVLWIPGVPTPQGSRRHVGRGITIEANPRLRPWRADAITVIQDKIGTDWTPITGGVQMHCVFWFPRPASHFRTGKYAGQLKESAPVHHIQKPDRDKLDRAVMDALTQSGLWRDDSQCWEALTTKAWTLGAPGTRIDLTWVT